MSFSAGKGGVFKLKNSAAVLIDLSSYIDDVQFPRDVAALETTTLGATAKTFIPGIKSGTIALKGHWDSGATAIDAHMTGILGQTATVTFEYGPEGGAVGQVKYTGESILTKFNVTTPVAGVVDWSADLQISGAVTRTVF